MHVVSFVLLSSLTLMLAIRFGGGYVFLLMALISLSQFAYIAVAIRRFYLQAGRWGAAALGCGRDAHLRAQLPIHDGGAVGRRGDRPCLGVAACGEGHFADPIPRPSAANPV
jgi:hypothetical protein